MASSNGTAPDAFGVTPAELPRFDEDSRLALVASRALALFADRGLQVEWSRGQLNLIVPREHHLALAAFLRDDAELRFVRFSDLCGLDALGLDLGYRFAVVYHVYSHDLCRWVGIRVHLDASDPSLPSLTPEWPAANWYERETYDLVGIQFVGHPNLTRLMLPDDWQGHPLQKDYPFEPEEVEFSFNVDRVNAGRVVARITSRRQAGLTGRAAAEPAS